MRLKQLKVKLIALWILNDMKFKLIIVLCFIAAATAFGVEQSANTNVNVTVSDANVGVAKKYVDIGDAYFHYEIAGQGTPVILINSDSNDNELFIELMKNHLAVRYDLRGYGKTDKPIEGEKFQHAEDLRKLMWFLGVRKAHLVGLSVGAFVAVDFAERYPAKVISLSIEDVNGIVIKETDADALLLTKNEYIHKRLSNMRKTHVDDTQGIVEFINSMEQ